MNDANNTENLINRLTEADRTMLRQAWAENATVWRFVPGRGSAKHLRKWLGKQGPADWHDIALHFDITGRDLSPLHFIASQPTADRASIMSLLVGLDLYDLERKRRPGDVRPHQTELLDLIVAGFAQGFYTTDRFGLEQPQSVLARTYTNLVTLSAPPLWPIPEQAWYKLQGKPHYPAYVWDSAANCQRLPFDVWVAAKIRPN